MAQPNKPSLLPEILGRVLDSDVLVGVKGGQRFKGKLCSYDIHMNLVLDEGVSLDGEKASKRYGTMFIRGDGVVFVAPLE
jgi:small nuclear ribonucleoprotein